jgi:hypothetical protein
VKEQLLPANDILAPPCRCSPEGIRRDDNRFSKTAMCNGKSSWPLALRGFSDAQPTSLEDSRPPQFSGSHFAGGSRSLAAGGHLQIMNQAVCLRAEMNPGCLDPRTPWTHKITRSSVTKPSQDNTLALSRNLDHITEIQLWHLYPRSLPTPAPYYNTPSRKQQTKATSQTDRSQTSLLDPLCNFQAPSITGGVLPKAND